MKKLAMEFLGTFFFVFTIAMTGNPFAIAAMLMAWLYIGASVSGSHYNPMVTVAIALRGKLAWHAVPWYIAAQTVGAVGAFFATSYFSQMQPIIPPAPAEGITLLQTFIVEALLAFVLAFIVLVVATSEKFKASHVFGFAIGFTIPALAVLGASTSGGIFNPAIALGANIVVFIQGNVVEWHYLAAYILGAFGGGLAAAYAFDFFYNEK